MVIGTVIIILLILIFLLSTALLVLEFNFPLKTKLIRIPPKRIVINWSRD